LEEPTHIVSPGVVEVFECEDAVGAGGEQNRRVMVTSARYLDLVRETKDAYNHRLRLVEKVC
jgi:hypothetical protein